jgi:TolB protein
MNDFLAKAIGGKVIVLMVSLLVVFSVSSKEILYLSNADGDLELYVSDIESGKTRQLTNNKLDDNQASWSPDGKWIVYTGRVGADLEIFMISSDGKSSRRLTHHDAGIDFSPQWSNDGKKILYISQTKHSYSLLELELKSNKTNTLLTSALQIKLPKWSPDNRLLSYISIDGKTSHLNVINLSSKKITPLTSFVKEQQIDFNWSPNSKDIVFCARRKKVIDLYRINIASKQEIQLTNLWTIDTEAAYSPDGEKLLFLSSREDKVRRQLFIGDKSLKTVTAITPQNVEVLNPTWSIDGENVAFSLYSQRRFVVMVKDLTTGENKLLNAADKGFQYFPKFRPRS